MAIGFRTKTFVAVASVATITVLVAALLFSLAVRRQVNAHIERTLVDEARLASELLSHHAASPALDDEADALGRRVEARVTLIAEDGRVVGDSGVARAALPALENHAGRPEVVAARQQGLGIARRFSHTLGRDMLYVAAPVRHPTVAVVRLALPLTDVSQQLAAVRHAVLVALGVALASALILAILASTLLGRRVNAIAVAARAYAAGDLSQPVRDYGGDEIGTVARVLDTTVRELAERLAELDRDRARLSAILAGMREGVMVMDAEGRVQLVNQAARAMLEIDPAVAGAHYVESVRHPGIAGIIGQALGGATPSPIEFQPAGSTLSLVARAAPVMTSPGAGALLVLHDVTDLRRADRVRRDFVANVSHELRTPLTAIRGYVEALAEDDVAPDERSRFLAVIARQAARMERLVQDLLRLASLDAREEPIEEAPCVLADLLQAVVRDLAPAIERKQQRVSIAVAPDVAEIVTDAAKVQDALRNLVENASAYSPEGSAIELSAAAEAERVVLRVADRGPGIPKSDLERIFERFYRVDKARSRESGGTGLGLSIVKHLVQRLGGDVRAENRPGGGAVFTVRLPRHQDRTA